MERGSWNVLLVDDDEDDYQVVKEYLSRAREGKFSIDWVASFEGGWEKLSAAIYDVVLVDDDLENRKGSDFIHQAIGQGYRMPFLLFANDESYEIDLQAMQAGAMDYLNRRELTPALLERSIRYAMNQKATLRALHESDERFHLAARAVNGVVYDWDLATNHIFRSDGLQQVIGVRPTEITQEHGWWEKRIHPDDYPIIEKTINEKIKGTADAYQVEYRVLHLAGYWIYVWDRAFILRDAWGKAYRVVGTRTDITDRRRGEQNARFLAGLGEQLLTLEDPQEMFAYATPAIMAHLEVERISFDQVDEAAQKITILSEQHALPPTVTGVYTYSPFHNALKQRMVKGQAIAVMDTATDPVTAPWYDPALKQFDIRSFVSVPRLRDGRWIGTLSVTNSTPRYWREDEVALLSQVSDLVWLAVENAGLLKQLKESQERFEVALRNTGVTVYTTDLERRYTWAYNARVDNDGGTIIGKRDEDIVDPAAFKDVIAAKNGVLASGAGLRKEFVINYRERPTYLDMTIEPLRNPEGMMEGLIVAVANTTRRHEIEEQMKQAEMHLTLQRQIHIKREEERQQIARDLHDGPIQDLLSLMFSIQAVLSLTRDEEVTNSLLEIQEETRGLINELRGLCNELRPPALVQFGLAKAIRSHTNALQERHKELQIVLEVREEDDRLNDSICLALYRIFQETMNNIIRHAGATEVRIQLDTRGNNVVLDIRDNGLGFDVPGDMMILAQQGHLGVVGMRERTEAIGGTFSIISTPGVGTRVLVRAPKSEMIISNS